MAVVRKEGKKVYIEGVRKVSWDTGEVCEFASALTAALACLGEDVPYYYVMGASGVAFRFTLDPGQWEPGNYSIRNISADPYEPIRRAFEAVGYEWTLHEKGSKAEDMARITTSIDGGTPVLAFGVVGPSDCCIVTGYDEDGEVLLGWSTYQNIPDDHNVPHDPTGYFRKPGWHDNLPGYMVIGNKVARRPLHEMYLDALHWAVHLARTPRVGRNYAGLAGLRLWAEEMTDPRYFPEGDEDVLGWRYLSTSINMTMLNDHRSAAPFLRQAAEQLPDLAPALLLAADEYTEACRLRNSLDQYIKEDFSPEALRGIADASARQAYARILVQIYDEEEKAIGQIGRALELLG